MNKEFATELAKPRHRWWEPYLFTAGVLLAIVVAFIVFGYITTIPYVELILFVLATIAAVATAFRSSSTIPTFIDKILVATFFTLASVAYISMAESALALVFAGMALIWLCLSVHAVVIRRARLKEQTAKFGLTVEALSRALSGDQKSSD